MIGERKIVEHKFNEPCNEALQYLQELFSSTDPEIPIDGRNAFVEDLRIYEEPVHTWGQVKEEQCALSVDAAPIGYGIKALKIALGVYREIKEREIEKGVSNR